MNNFVFLKGRLGRAAELRYTANGKAMVTLSVAISRFQGKDKEEATDWFSVVAWEALAEAVADATKGAEIVVEGRLQTRSWSDDQGVKHERTEVVASNIAFTVRRPKREDTSDRQPDIGGWGDGDLPFE